ncbi:MAG: hypothetical protein AUH81_14370 [Candidatus Rokubacteria bacterium 13_1_40CM_4_69_5]|nr:MAG: hypothetical protein AUH81_14370 [Candidatus Rokubacteria bacterium 13_1_40CM_4_69_5]
MLAFSTTEPRTYGPEELTFLASFADQAAVAIDNARLYESLERRLGRVRTLSRLNQLVSSSLDMDEVLREITLAAAHLMEATLASFWVADETRRTLQLLAFSDPVLGADLPVKGITFAEGALGWVATNRQTANIPDVAADHRVLSQEWWKKRGLRSYLAVPVVFEGSLYAVLALYGRRPFRIELDDRDLIDGFVAQAAVAIRNARLFAESERRRSIAEALAGVGRALAQSLDVAVISERIAESLRGLLRARSSAVYRLDAKSGDLVVMAGTGMLATMFEPNTVLPAGSVAHLAVAQCRPIATSNVLDDPQLTITADVRARLGPETHRSALAVPLLVHETVIGALGIGDVEGRVFDDEELRLTQAFADQAAIALENARLYEEAHAQRKRLTQIFDSTTDGIMFVRPDGRIEAANRRAAEVLGIEDDAVVGADLIDLLVQQTAAAADDLFAARRRGRSDDRGAQAGAALGRQAHAGRRRRCGGADPDTAGRDQGAGGQPDEVGLRLLRHPSAPNATLRHQVDARAGRPAGTCPRGSPDLHRGRPWRLRAAHYAGQRSVGHLAPRAGPARRASAANRSGGADGGGTGGGAAAHPGEGPPRFRLGPRRSASGARRSAAAAAGDPEPRLQRHQIHAARW